MKTFKIVVLIALLLIIMGCRNTAPTDISITEFSHSEQNFKIISAYEGLYCYVEEAKKLSNPNPKSLQKLYSEIFINRVFDFGVPTIKYHHNVIYNIAELEKQLHELENYNVEDILQSTLIKSAEILPGPDINIFVMPHNRYITKASGYIHNGDIYIYPSTKWTESAIQAIIAHEYNHIVAMENRHPPNDLLGFLVFEGKAEAFAKLSIGYKISGSICIEQEKEMWEIIEDYLCQNTTTICDKLSSLDEMLPNCRYIIGYNIVNSFIQRHPHLSIEEWTHMDEHEIFVESGYVEYLNR
ncbi:DUF2268 domain-containing putative Zn-dependent protease [Alkaliphilus peptidifermentans]|uniref:Uncharacterized protein YjaZ n=1 Tax=Alkaliphilus peptidifermentans DSM 18978 TaxID=1120976 RepID=A0A1G5HPF7_9FIRM|nr:DUF2268 domain-containing putative Zn-dependent protease [Alkaliphilus peptidifermentans]SCY65200.1 Uncharacterized protein YjaZ [Alkaliphilus peptidifermentans DSM 18978]